RPCRHGVAAVPGQARHARAARQGRKSPDAGRVVPGRERVLRRTLWGQFGRDRRRYPRARSEGESSASEGGVVGEQSRRGFAQGTKVIKETCDAAVLDTGPWLRFAVSIESQLLLDTLARSAEPVVLRGTCQLSKFRT